MSSNENNKTKKRAKGPKYHKWNPNKNAYFLLKPYQLLKDPDVENGRLMPLGMRELLTDEQKLIYDISTFDNLLLFDYYYTNPTKIPKNINTINQIQSDLVQTNDQISNNYIDLSQNIGTYLSHTQYLSKNNEKYHYSDDQDPNVIIRQSEPKDLKTGLMNDINEMKLYENTIFVTSVIAGATFLIAAIILTKK
jgi:hypothetical protein